MRSLRFLAPIFPLRICEKIPPIMTARFTPVSAIAANFAPSPELGQIATSSSGLTASVPIHPVQSASAPILPFSTPRSWATPCRRDRARHPPESERPSPALGRSMPLKTMPASLPMGKLSAASIRKNCPTELSGPWWKDWASGICNRPDLRNFLSRRHRSHLSLRYRDLSRRRRGGERPQLQSLPTVSH